MTFFTASNSQKNFFKIMRAVLGLSVFCVLCVIFACNSEIMFPGGDDANTEGPPKVFKITPARFTLKAGNTYPLAFTGQPYGTESVAWFSDAAFATVDSAGSVTGISVGMATITVKALSSNGAELASAESKVTVGRETLVPTDFAVVPSETVISLNETMQLTTENLPYGAAALWDSDSAEVAVVDALTGVVTATGIGEAVITASMMLGGAVLNTAVCTVTVLSTGRFKINPSMLSLAPGLSETLTAENLPSETVSLEWSSPAQGCATVADAGSGTAVVTGVSGGKVMITVRAKDYSGTVLSSASCAVTVGSVLPFKIDQSNLTLSEFGGMTLLSTSNAPPGTASITWSSGNPSVLVISPAGFLRVVDGPDLVTITAKAMPTSGSMPLAITTCTVTVNYTPPPPDADTLAVLVQSGTYTNIYLRSPTYTLANVISSAIASATVGTPTEPSKIKLIAGKTYTITAEINTKAGAGDTKHLQISTYSPGTATIKRSAKTYPVIKHDMSGGTLVLGNGDAAKTLVLDGDVGIPGPDSGAQVLQLDNGTVILKDGIEITGGTNGGVRTISDTSFIMEGGVIRNNSTGLSGGGIRTGIGFKKTGGTIYGSDGGANANTAQWGSAVSGSGKRRETTAGPDVNLDYSTDENWD